MAKQARVETAWGRRVQHVRSFAQECREAWTPPPPKEGRGDAERSDATAAAGEEDWREKDRVKTLRISRRPLQVAAARAWARQRLVEREQGIRRRQARGLGRVQRRRAERRAQQLHDVLVAVAGMRNMVQAVQEVVCWWRVQVQAHVRARHTWEVEVMETSQQEQEEGRRQGMVVALHAVAWAQRRWFRMEVRLRMAAWRAKVVRAAQRECHDAEDRFMAKGLGPGARRWTCRGCNKSQLTKWWEWKHCAQCMEKTSQLVAETTKLQRKKSGQERDIHELERRLTDLRAHREELVWEIRGVAQSEAALEHKATMAVLEERQRRAETRLKEAQARRKEVVTELRDMEEESALVHRIWAGERENHELRKELHLQGTGEAVGAMMETATAGTQCFEARDMGQGIKMWTYRKAELSEFKVEVDGVEVDGVQAARHTRWRRECRGLVVGADGVVARPLHKFFSPGQMAEQSLVHIDGMIIQEATVKLDGIMVFGVVLDGVVEFWTRGGRTDEAVKVTRWVHEQRVALGSEGPDCVGLVLAADAMGQTVIFEWVGRQARIKVKELETRLVVLQVRDKVTGAYVKFEQREALAMRFQVACVARVTELEGRRLGRVFHGVKTDMTRFEGVVLQLVEGKGSDGDVTVSDIPLMLKVKTQWWLNAEQHKYQRWRSEEQHAHEEERRHRKRKHLQVQELRAMVKGWPGDRSPGLLCEWEQVQKVECFQARGTGKRGAIIVSFGTVEDKRAMQEGVLAAGLAWSLENAYSCRSSSNSWHRVRTWYTGKMEAEEETMDETFDESGDVLGSDTGAVEACYKVAAAATYHGLRTTLRWWGHWRRYYQWKVMRAMTEAELRRLFGER